MPYKFVTGIYTLRQCGFPPLKVARQRRALTVSNSERNPLPLSLPLPVTPSAILSYMSFRSRLRFIHLPFHSSHPFAFLSLTIFTQLTYGFDFIGYITFLTCTRNRMITKSECVDRNEACQSYEKYVPDHETFYL